MTVASDTFHASNEEFATGWLSPDGQIFVVPLYEHFEFFLKHPDLFPGVKQVYDEMVEYIDDEADAYIAQVTPGEHPEWHNHEIWADGYRDRKLNEVRETLYEAGWGRIGTFSWQGLPKIEIETKSLSKPALEALFEDFLRQTRREVSWHLVDDKTPRKRRRW